MLDNIVIKIFIYKYFMPIFDDKKEDRDSSLLFLGKHISKSEFEDKF